ncbi:hypothetical protein GGR59_003397 [Xanthomonas arboricola]|uniref:YobI family P-loop NTPase n=1 Tax=Xanthomonas arboricola TaxID=56448 RepID=UPI0016164943|nr:hypothetical protein [Xanthomonas arboricola]MBB4607116.1 hypothetical protein [Xanthomonas arboricola]
MTSEHLPILMRLRKAWTLLCRAAAALKETPPREGTLEALTPVILGPEDSRRYEQELATAMTNPLVRNIAITGSYGAGKSSLIKTFKANHPEYVYASVSLATFRKEGVITVNSDEIKEHSEEPGQIQKGDGAAGDLIERIEQTIVQQLLYSVSANKLPKTRLKRIVQTSTKRVLAVTALVATGILAGARLYLPLIQTPETLKEDGIIDAIRMIPVLPSLAAVTALFLYALWSIVKSLSGLHIDGWAIKGGKLETLQHGSVLHKNVDEIIYCFQNSSIEVVVIEDLDRFGIQDVFFRLREINAIINQSPQVGRPVRFLYALNDELFAGSEKTKFFDVILPIVPVVNKENSHDKMAELLKLRTFNGTSHLERLDPEMLETICYRIDDMRLIKNIVNEFDLFSQVLMENINLHWNKLFAMTVIKNLHSDQYWGLSKRSGETYAIIAGFTEWRRYRTATLNEERQALENKLATKAQDIAKSLAELRAIVWFDLQQRGGTSSLYILNGHGAQYTLNQFVTDEVFSEFASSTQVQYLSNGSGRMGNQLKTSESLVALKYDYRCSAIETDDSELVSEINEKSRQLSAIQQITLSQALRDGYQEQVQEKLSKHETIRYLLVSGHLDQDYTDYLGHFYGHKIDREDMNLILTLRQGETVDLFTPIANPAKFVKKLSLEHIDRGRGLIADLLSYLCVSYINGDHVKLQMLQKILDDAAEYIRDFLLILDQASHTGTQRPIVRATYSLRPSLFSDALEHLRDKDASSKSRIVFELLDNLSALELQGLHDRKSLIESISELEDVSQIVPKLVQPAGGWTWIKLAGIRFSNLDNTTSTEQLETLIKEDALAPTLEMLRLVASKTIQPGDVPSIVSIQSLLLSQVTGAEVFVNENAAAIILEILSQEKIIPENETSVLFAANLLSEDTDIVQALFNNTDYKILTPEKLPSYLWESAVEQGRLAEPYMVVSLYNIIQQKNYESESLSKTIAEYITSNAVGISERIRLSTDAYEDFAHLVAVDPSFSDATACLLLMGLEIYNPDTLGNRASSARIQMMAEHRILALSPGMIKMVLDQPRTTQTAYFAGWWESIAQTHVEDDIPLGTVMGMFSRGALRLDDAIRLTSRFDADEFTQLSSDVPIFTELARSANHQGVVFPANLSRASALILYHYEPNNQDAAEILIQGIPLMDWASISEVLRRFGNGLETLKPHSRFAIPSSDVTDRILSALHRRRFVSRLDDYTTRAGDKEKRGYVRKNLT